MRAVQDILAPGAEFDEESNIRMAAAFAGDALRYSQGIVDAADVIFAFSTFDLDLNDCADVVFDQTRGFEREALNTSVKLAKISKRGLDEWLPRLSKTRA